MIAKKWKHNDLSAEDSEIVLSEFAWSRHSRDEWSPSSLFSVCCFESDPKSFAQLLLVIRVNGSELGLAGRWLKTTNPNVVFGVGETTEAEAAESSEKREFVNSAGNGRRQPATVMKS